MYLTSKQVAVYKGKEWESLESNKSLFSTPSSSHLTLQTALSSQSDLTITTNAQYSYSYGYHRRSELEMDYLEVLTPKKKKKHFFCCFFPMNRNVDFNGDNDDISYDSDSDSGLDDSDCDISLDDLDEMIQEAENLPSTLPQCHSLSKPSENIQFNQPYGESSSREENCDSLSNDNQETIDNAHDDLNGLHQTDSMKSKLNRNSTPAQKSPVSADSHQEKSTVRKIIEKDRSHDISSKETTNTASSSSRRHLFPTYSKSSSLHQSSTFARTEQKPTTKPKVRFSTNSRAKLIQSKSNMNQIEKSQIWWSREDYADFKKTAIIISKAMMEGGSEIWLDGNDISPTPNTPSCEETKENLQDISSKWWCRFGHSRRGLEHVVSIEEGQQRQKHVKDAIQAVLDEQERQRLSKRHDYEKLASVYKRHTLWARDLALSAGAADAEAVRSRFDSKAKSRLGYLKTEIMHSMTNRHSHDVKFSASFILSANKIKTDFLDANTTSSLRRKCRLGLEGNKKRKNTNEDKLVHALQDQINLSKLAAGYGSSSREDMSVVLSGMGSVVMSRIEKK